MEGSLTKHMHTQTHHTQFEMQAEAVHNGQLRLYSYSSGTVKGWTPMT